MGCSDRLPSYRSLAWGALCGGGAWEHVACPAPAHGPEAVWGSYLPEHRPPQTGDVPSLSSSP